MAQPEFRFTDHLSHSGSESMWAHFHGDQANPFHRIIPIITGGLRRISESQRKKLTMLLWHFRTGTLRTLPSSTRLLILCAVIDGLLKLIAEARDPEHAATDKTWQKANDVLGFSWDKWTSGIFEVWGKASSFARSWLALANGRIGRSGIFH